MNTDCHISGLGCFIPKDVLDNAQLERMVDTSDEWIVSRTGIKERRIIADDMNTSDLAVAAAQAALADAGLLADTVTHIFVATCTPDYLSPSVACLVAHKLGKNARSGQKGRVMCLDLNAACSGFVYGLEMARAITALRPESVVLLIGGEALSRRLNYSDNSTCVLFGDGAGAVIIQNAPQRSLWRILDSSCCADGEGNGLIRLGGGTAFKARPGLPVPDDFFVKMSGREVFRQAVRAMSAESMAMLDRHGLSVDSLDLLIAHQANLRIIEAVGKRMAISQDKVFVNVERFGNTSAATLPIALDDARAQGVLRPGMRVLLTTFGGGTTWGAALLGA